MNSKVSKPKHNSMGNKRKPPMKDEKFVPGKYTSNDGFFVKPSPKAEKPSSTSSAVREKKPFDKKLYRMKKYSKKYKLDQWADKRKKQVLREYYKQINHEKPGLDVRKIYEQDSDNEATNDNENNLNEDINRAPNNVPEEASVKRKPFQKARLEFQRIKEERHNKRKDFEKRKAEKEEALKEYKKKKAEKFKKLNKRTRKGQPIMKDRMEMMLEEIERKLKDES